MLTSRVSVPDALNPTQEDIFSSSLSSLFTDDAQNSHGTPGQAVIYRSPRYGPVKLSIPQHPDVEEGRKLFAHYLWNAGVVVADAVESASDEEADIVDEGRVKWSKVYWNVRGKDVLELGAGTALPSLISALSGAKSVTITDHPSSPALVTDTIAHNVLENLKINLFPHSARNSEHPPRTTTTVRIDGLTWGTDLFTSAQSYGKASTPQPAKHSFDKIIIADCLWMPSQHANLVHMITSYLRLPREPLEPSCALVVAGFHTGRSTVARFLEIATGSRSGMRCEREDGHDIEGREENDLDEEETAWRGRGVLVAAETFEIDVDCNVRLWLPERSGESREQTKRWCVCAVLVRRDGSIERN